MSLLNFLVNCSSAAEDKVTKMQDALKEVQNTHIKEVDEMNAQLERQRQRSEELTEDVSSYLINFFSRAVLASAWRANLTYLVSDEYTCDPTSSDKSLPMRAFRALR